MGPTLYSGVAGVALFLAELARLTGESPFRKAAIGAVRQALSNFHTVPEPQRNGLYSGALGILLCAARVAVDFDDGALQCKTRRLLRKFRLATIESGTGFDMTTGAAGGIMALLALRKELGDDRFLPLAEALGNQLIETAHRTGKGWSWKSREDRRRAGLTGLSHGASGVGLALSRLSLAFSELRYREAAKEAFRYERRFYDSRVGNWTDIRKRAFHGRSSGGAFSLAWCHGAPGIALSRMHSLDACRGTECEWESEQAVATTARAVALSVSKGPGDYGLCHGVTGNADILLEAESVDSKWNEHHAVARSVALLIQRRLADGLPLFFDGSDDATALGLMTGLAGAGYFLLRASDNTVPSILSFVASESDS